METSDIEPSGRDMVTSGKDYVLTSIKTYSAWTELDCRAACTGSSLMPSYVCRGGCLPMKATVTIQSP